MPYDIPSEIIPEKNALAGTSPWVWIAELHPTAVERLYLANDNASLEFDGETYMPFPFEIGQQDHDGSGNIASLSLTMSNVNKYWSILMKRSRGFTGRVIILSLINRSATPVRVLRQTFRTQGATVTDQAVVFTIGFDDLFKVAFPSGKMFRERCPFRYKGALCGADSELATCDHTARSENGCEAHGNAPRFGGFLGIPRAA